MPNRIVREGILTSPKMAKLGWAEEVLFRRLMSVVDDFGRYFAEPGLLRAACYPRQLNKVSDSDIGKWLTALVEAALVRVYPALDGESYLEIPGFGQQVRAKKSKFPDPLSECAANAKQMQSNEHLDVSVFVSDVSTEDSQISVQDDAKAPPPVASLPLADGSEHGFTETQVAEWSAIFPGVDVLAAMGRMKAWLKANPTKRKTRRGVERFVVSWLGREQDSPRAGRPSQPVAKSQPWAGAR